MHGAKKSDGEQEFDSRDSGGQGRWCGREVATFGSASEEGLFVCFLCEEGEDVGEYCEEDYSPLGPTPVLPDCDERADNWSFMKCQRILNYVLLEMRYSDFGLTQELDPETAQERTRLSAQLFDLAELHPRYSLHQVLMQD